MLFLKKIIEKTKGFLVFHVCQDPGLTLFQVQRHSLTEQCSYDDSKLSVIVSWSSFVFQPNFDIPEQDYSYHC